MSPLTVATASVAHPAAIDAARRAPAWRYHLLRAAVERFSVGVAALTPTQRAEAESQAERTLALEERVLASAEARDVVIPLEQIEQAVGAVARRYGNAGEFSADLAANGLDEAGLRHALRRELLFDAVMQRVGAQHAPVDETDERLFYELHLERFHTPERRTARHILITINDDYAENHREQARARLAELADALAGCADPDTLTARFIAAAERHSECPTAMDGGSLGQVSAGQLYPEVDAALFALAAGGVSAICESPLGFHLVLCEAIEPAVTVPFEAVRARLHAALLQRRRRECQRAWLASLPGAG